MAATPQIQKGSGPDALPEGAASEVNAIPQTMSSEAGAAQVATGAQEAGAGPAPVSDEEMLTGLQGQTPQAPVNFQPQTDQDKFLFAPGTGTGGVVPGNSLTAGKLPPPHSVVENLPLLQAAAADPEASPATRALVGLIAYHVSQG